MTAANTLAVARKYADAMNAKDFGTLTGMFAEDIVWHQPGHNRHSGAHCGSTGVGRMIGRADGYPQSTATDPDEQCSGAIRGSVPPPLSG
jgi:ketosteroid isomerase-like protein